MPKTVKVAFPSGGCFTTVLGMSDTRVAVGWSPMLMRRLPTEHLPEVDDDDPRVKVTPRAVTQVGSR
jgi:hypothetical protein